MLAAEIGLFKISSTSDIFSSSMHVWVEMCISHAARIACYVTWCPGCFVTTGEIGLFDTGSVGTSCHEMEMKQEACMKLAIAICMTHASWPKTWFSWAASGGSSSRRHFDACMHVASCSWLTMMNHAWKTHWKIIGAWPQPQHLLRAPPANTQHDHSMITAKKASHKDAASIMPTSWCTAASGSCFEFECVEPYDQISPE